MAENYQKMMDSTFGKYYERFRELNALSKENAVTIEELFPDERPFLLKDRMHKMLSSGIVKRKGVNRYWLDEERASDSKGVLKQKLLIIVAGVLVAILLIVLDKFGIVSL